MALVELLPKAIQQQVREGKILAQVAMKYLVPLARQSVEDCQRDGGDLRPASLRNAGGAAATMACSSGSGSVLGRNACATPEAKTQTGPVSRWATFGRSP